MRLTRALWARRWRHAERTARFVLLYTPPGEEPVHVGELEFDGSAWVFRYSEEYRSRRDLRPIEGFDDLGREYRSTALFPFFAVRIPDVERPDVQKKLRQKRVIDPEATDMLRLFGRRVVSSPAFELVPA